MLGDDAENAALETLFFPFATNRLAWSEQPTLFLRARMGPSLTRFGNPAVLCEQTFKPEADALENAGLQVTAHAGLHESFPLVLVLPPRQRDEARALLARAVKAAESGGRVVAAASNNSGARTLEADLARLTGSVESQSKHKCRVFWTPALSAATVNAALVDEWLRLDAPRPILDGRYISRPGVFAWDRIDPASELLAGELSERLAGRAADLGAGFGYLSVELLQRCPGITALHLYEAEARALDLARSNLGGARVPIEFRWHDVAAGLPERYDVIVTNPPFHTGSGAEDPSLGRRFIAEAARALNPGGRLWLVANRHLPYENVLNASFGNVRTVTQRHGFKILEATRAPGGRR